MRCVLSIDDGRTWKTEVDLPVTIGRADDCGVIVAGNGVSRRHIRLDWLDGVVTVTDLGGVNGTRLNGVRIPPSVAALVRPNDELLLAETKVAVSYDAAGPVGAKVPLAQSADGQDVMLKLTRGKTLVVGRAEECDLFVDHPSVSRRHAQIRGQEAEYWIEDLGSTNGTFVAGARVGQSQRISLHDGDVVHFGQVRFVVSEEMLRPATPARAGEIGLDAIHLHQRINAQVDLLRDISLSIRPREFVAVVGVSGAGKSTLVAALSGFKPASHGAVLANDLNLYENFDTFRNSLGYVPQDDILHRELPLQRALEYSARLRLPADTTERERTERVEEVIGHLGLEARRDVRIGSLSGGQRKRVSIGAELITEPGLFFLDEATSGLDPGTEVQLMRLLRSLADEGHTIILITHATKNVALCDQVCFLARGGYLAYYGPPSEALDYFDVDDFDGIYEKLENESTPEAWGTSYLASPQRKEFVEERLGPRLNLAAETNVRSQSGQAWKPKRRIGPLAETAILTRRYIDVITRDRTTLILLLAIAPALGAIDLVAWQRDIILFNGGDAFRAGIMLFLAALLPFMIGSLTSVREIVKEDAIYRRERAVGLHIIPYLLSKIIVLFGLSAFWALVLVVMKLAAVELSDMSAGNLVAFYITVFFGSASGVMVGLLVSAVVRRDEQAMLYAVGIVVMQIVFSGGLVPLGDLGPVGRGLGTITSTHWVLRGMMNVMDFQTGDCETPPYDSCRIAGLGQFQTEQERIVAIAPTLDRADGLLGRPLWESWTGASTLIVVMFVMLFFIERRKDVF